MSLWLGDVYKIMPWHHFQERMVTTLLFSEPTRRSPEWIYAHVTCTRVLHEKDQSLSQTAFQNKQGKHVGDRVEAGRDKVS